MRNILLAAILLTGCATTPRQDLTQMCEQHCRQANKGACVSFSSSVDISSGSREVSTSYTVFFVKPRSTCEADVVKQKLQRLLQQQEDERPQRASIND